MKCRCANRCATSCSVQLRALPPAQRTTTSSCQRIVCLSRTTSSVMRVLRTLLGFIENDRPMMSRNTRCLFSSTCCAISTTTRRWAGKRWPGDNRVVVIRGMGEEDSLICGGGSYTDMGLESWWEVSKLSLDSDCESSDLNNN